MPISSTVQRGGFPHRKEGSPMRLAVGTLALVAFVGFARTASAQDGNNGTPTILQAVQNLQTTVDSLTERLITLQNSVNVLSAASQGQVRFTPPAFVFAPDDAGCEAVNVTNATRTVRLQLIDGLAGALLVDSGNVSIAPGVAYDVAKFLSPGQFFQAYCKFTVVDGSRTDIRADLTISVFAASIKLAVPAE
jgi:hypothetical protein